MDALKDKRVAIIGTGATAVQVVPRVALDAKELFVFQRTPSSVDVRNNKPTDPAWFAEIATLGWQQKWIDSFSANMSNGPTTEDLVQDGWTDLSRRIRDKVVGLPKGERTPMKILAAFEDADNEKMDHIRSRVDEDVEDKNTAAKLKAWYRQLCKRPCFHDEFLQAFNRPGVHLVDTDGKGVEKITETSVVVAGQAYPVDCIVYASGFQVGFDTTCTFDIIGRDGVKLAAYWADGMRSMHGIHVHGFPNAFLVQPAQGANMIANVPSGINDSGKTIAAIVKHALDNKYTRVEVSKEAEDAWLELCASGPGRVLGALDDCTPGYYNNEGQPDKRSSKLVGYPQGSYMYFQYIFAWRNSGTFEGIAFSSQGPPSRL